MKAKIAKVKKAETEVTEMAAPEQLYKVASRDTVKRGFLLEFVD
jgi:hypothetical protein